MSHSTCKRIWEGPVGIAIQPRKKNDGTYFWTFTFVRAYRRNRNADWEYAHHFTQKHAKALGVLMAKGFHFMENTDPSEFVTAAMAKATGSQKPDSLPEAA